MEERERKGVCFVGKCTSSAKLISLGSAQFSVWFKLTLPFHLTETLWNNARITSRTGWGHRSTHRFFWAPSSLQMNDQVDRCPPDDHTVSMTLYWVIHSCCVMCFCKDALWYEYFLAGFVLIQHLLRCHPWPT